MPIIYGNPGTGRVHKTDQPVFSADHGLPKGKCSRGRRSKPCVRSDGKRYATVVDAALDVSGDPGKSSNITRACRGKYRKAYGYGWRYEEEVNNGKATA